MISYFYNKYLKYKLSPINVKNCYFLETTPIICANIISKDKFFFNANFLLYSILSFYIGIRLIIEHKLSLLVIIEYMDMNILKLLLNNNNLHIVSEKAGIPGILSNSSEIWHGNRYLSHVTKNSIQLTTYPNFIFLCSTKRMLISQEANNQLIPQFAVILTITNILSNYFIPLFTPKGKAKKKIKNLIRIKKELTNNNINTIPYFLIKRYAIEKYLIITDVLKIKGYLIYFLFLNSIQISFNK